jgi:hypothetical protein
MELEEWTNRNKEFRAGIFKKSMGAGTEEE